MVKAKANRVSVPDIHLFQTLASSEHGGAETAFERLAVQFHRRGLCQTPAVRLYPRMKKQFKGEGIQTISCKFRGVVKILQRQKIKRTAHASAGIIGVLRWL